jgi:hypothetical protein
MHLANSSPEIATPQTRVDVQAMSCSLIRYNAFTRQACVLHTNARHACIKLFPMRPAFIIFLERRMERVEITKQTKAKIGKTGRR